IGCTKFPETQILKLINDIDESTTDRNHIVTRLNNLLNFLFEYQQKIQSQNRVSLQEQMDRVLSNKVLLTNTSWWYSVSEFTKRSVFKSKWIEYYLIKCC
ncbi:MAG: hypothetical protein ACW99Q_24835, partial [Candidatus Kariarchaeaceae archaeon]